MIHVFLLIVYLGTGPDRQLISNNMYFYSITECNYFAAQTAKRYGNYTSIELMDSKDKVTAYCVPKYIKEGSVEVY
jgi:hypothetical protein|tara:strand:- start:129 stop:356 length:228 start_codon:yes stop_codon:yes gene_type:complete